MSKHFRQLAVKEVIKETKDAVSIVFEIPSDQKQDFKYKAGQYLTIKADIKGESVRRSYSLSSSPSIDSFLKVTSKKVENGKMSHYLFDHVNVGDTLEVMLPDGNFVLETDAIKSKRYILFAAGSGITPIISILKTALEEEPRSTVHLIYGNRKIEDIIFYDELQSLSANYSDRLTVQYIISQGAIDGGKNNTRITPEIVSAIVAEEQQQSTEKAYFICGPEGMIQVTNETLKNAGVDSKTIHIEHFTNSAVDEGKETVYEGDVNEVIAILDGEEHKLILQKGETILEAADRQGIDPPYSCQSGVCTTCKALVTRGEVEMGESFGLDDEEIAEGFVLTCCSRPKTAGVIVNYDDI